MYTVCVCICVSSHTHLHAYAHTRREYICNFCVLHILIILFPSQKNKKQFRKPTPDVDEEIAAEEEEGASEEGAAEGDAGGDGADQQR